MEYNLINAVCYEITNLLIQHNGKWASKKWIQMIRDNCFKDWIEWKTERTMERVDLEIEKVIEELDKQRDTKPTIIQYEPDGSKVQKILGGKMEIKSR